MTPTLSLKQATERFWSRVVKTDGCWNWSNPVPKGYGECRLTAIPERSTHRIAWHLTHGAIPAGLLVLHRCDNIVCCNPAHLFLGGTAKNFIPDLFWATMNRSGDCWVWARYYPSDGYARTKALGQNFAHRIAWVLANGRSIPPGMCVCHHCDNPPCCNPAHLFLGTHQDNMADMVAKGRSRKRKANQ